MLALLWWCVKLMFFAALVVLLIWWFVWTWIDSWRRMKAGPPQRKIMGER